MLEFLFILYMFKYVMYILVIEQGDSLEVIIVLNDVIMNGKIIVELAEFENCMLLKINIQLSQWLIVFLFLFDSCYFDFWFVIIFRNQFYFFFQISLFSCVFLDKDFNINLEIFRYDSLEDLEIISI